MFVKICGVMDVETARFAVQKGANFIGLLFSKASPRAISLEQAKEIVKVVRSLGAEPVAVFADESLEEMRFIIEAFSLNIVQLHGQIPREFCDEIAQQKIYVADGLPLPKTLDSKRDFLLFENHFEDPKNFRFFIAGNLNAENVRTNIERFKPHGVDASRGVREKKGIEAFIEQARRVPDHKNFQRGLSPDFSAQQSAEGESNLHQVVEPERKAGLKKMGQSPKNFCGRVLGRFGAFGGQYVPELLIEPLKQLEKAFNEIDFEEEFLECLREFAGRPTAITEVPRFAKAIDGPRIFLKREDLLHTGAHKINNAIGQCLLAKKMGKTRVIAETGAGQHGVATATACAFLGLECVIYMGKVDMERQEPNVVKMRLLGAEVIAVTTGAQTLKDAVSEALRDYAASYETTHYCLGSALGPHPYPTMVAKFQKIIGEEAKEQMQKRVGRDPDLCIACVGGGSNAIGLFSSYLNTEATLVGVEAAGAARFQKGSPGVLHGTYSYLLQDENGQVQETHSISAGLDYPSVGPKHAELFEAGRVQYDICTDEEALSAFRLLSRTEGIIPALESAHALGYLARVGKDLPKDFVVLVNLSGRGDKDVAHIQSLS